MVKCNGCMCYQPHQLRCQTSWTVQVYEWIGVFIVGRHCVKVVCIVFFKWLLIIVRVKVVKKVKIHDSQHDDPGLQPLSII